ncbi:MazF family transcriptional regulator [Vreelandella salicampi]|uniref:MazF family transcriptional regulator n=1 Tax=Vreelandella salicampi TaxID=1449798 RepID=A0A7Z0LKL8_9GAMM|nr:MazF family transcriptional regulator [Halomonas salicampi]NYS60716.1 MazF family transcriptional regulator [Halomonas salicampi]
MKKKAVMAQTAEKGVNKPTLPFTESALLEGLTPETAHADEIATPTAHELGQEKTDALFNA